MEIVKMINRGMITIPAKLRQKFSYQDGMKFMIESSENGALKLIPLIDVEKEQDWYLDSETILKVIEKNRENEIERENS